MSDNHNNYISELIAMLFLNFASFCMCVIYLLKVYSSRKNTAKIVISEPNDFPVSAVHVHCVMWENWGFASVQSD